VLEGNDTLAVMPTGSGKSAIYQIPAVLIDGPTVIVSPLIALQKDQAEYLQGRDVHEFGKTRRRIR
jgi:ATP-dependent DNA helicase RecQ